MPTSPRVSQYIERSRFIETVPPAGFGPMWASPPTFFFDVLHKILTHAIVVPVFPSTIDFSSPFCHITPGSSEPGAAIKTVGGLLPPVSHRGIG